MRRLLLRLFVGLVIITVVGLGFLVIRKATTPVEVAPARERPPAVVEVDSIRFGTIREIRRLTGTLHPLNETRISPKISGRLESLMIDIGDVVERGQVIARLDDDELKQEVEQARSNLAVAEANLGRVQVELEQAQRELRRVEELNERRVASVSVVDTARLAADVAAADVQVARAELRQREAALRAAEIRLGYTEIRADWEGGSDQRAVATRLANEGEMLSSTSTIVTLVDIGQLRGVMFVTESDYPRLSVGQQVQVRADAFPGLEGTGTISRLAPLFVETSRQARVEVLVQNPDRLLKPGMFVRTDVELQRRDNVTLIPIRALVDRDGVRGVLLADREASVGRFVPVKIGIQEGTMAEVLEPRIEGEVIVLGQNLVNDGAPIRIVESRGVPAPTGEGSANPTIATRSPGAAAGSASPTPSLGGS